MSFGFQKAFDGRKECIALRLIINIGEKQSINDRHGLPVQSLTTSNMNLFSAISAGRCDRGVQGMGNLYALKRKVRLARYDNIRALW